MAASRLRLLLLCGSLAVLPQDSQPSTTKGHLDPSHAFYYPTFAKTPDMVLAKTKAGPIDAATYLRYLAARHDTRQLEDLAFDVLLVKECKARGVAGSAPLLARGLAARRMLDSGRKRKDDPDGSLQRKFATEALRQLRIDALVAVDRKKDETALRALFERRHGGGGEKVRVRHVLVSFTAMPDKDAARQKARTLHAELKAGKSFESLLPQSNDRATRRMLRDPKRTAKAGFLEGYNYRKYGDTFAATVRSLKVGSYSRPVRSDIGYHLVQLVARKVTRFEDVKQALEQELGRGPAKPSEARALRKALLKKYGYRPKSGAR